MKQFLFLSLLGSTFFANVAGAKNGSTVTCANVRFPITVVIELSVRNIKVFDNVTETVLSRIQEFDIEKNTKARIQLTQKSHKDLPRVIFEGDFNKGLGTGVSYDDLSGGKSDYLCTRT